MRQAIELGAKVCEFWVFQSTSLSAISKSINTYRFRVYGPAIGRLARSLVVGVDLARQNDDDEDEEEGRRSGRVH
jgi:hypothetical protein